MSCKHEHRARLTAHVCLWSVGGSKTNAPFRSCVLFRFSQVERVSITKVPDHLLYQSQLMLLKPHIERKQMTAATTTTTTMTHSSS